MASKLTQKTTLYLEPHVKKFLQLRALQLSKSISFLVNQEFEYLLKKFESSKKLAKNRQHPSIAEWEIVKSELDKKPKA